VKFILANPFYYGHFRYAGEIFEGKHTPLIDKQLFDKVQSVLVQRGHPHKPDSEPKELCGLFKCGECGCMITGEDKIKRQKNGNVHSYTYYHCTKKKGLCSQPCIREEILDAELSQIITDYAMPRPWANEMYRLADEDEKDTSKTTAVFVSDLREKASELSRKLDRLTDLFVDQDLDRQTYLAKKREVMSEKRSAEEQIGKLQKGSAVWLEPLRNWVKDASLLDETAKTNDLPSKKLSLQKIFGSNLSLRNKKIEFAPVEHYASLREARLNFSENDLSFIKAHLYLPARTHFTTNFG
jgi:hypothetical protein